MKKLYSTLLLLVISSCSTTSIFVNEDVVNSWKNVPVKELDTHSFFITIPMIKTITDSGIEIRNYRNGGTVQRCSASSNGYTSYNTFATCSQSQVACNNLFYIQNNVVIEYKLVGSCRTAQFLRPEYRF